MAGMVRAGLRKQVPGISGKGVRRRAEPVGRLGGGNWLGETEEQRGAGLPGPRRTLGVLLEPGEIPGG